MQISDLKAKLSRQLEEAIGRYNAARTDVEKLQFALSTLQDITEPQRVVPATSAEPDDALTRRGPRPFLTKRNGAYGKIQPAVLTVVAAFERENKREFRNEEIYPRLPFRCNHGCVNKALDVLRQQGLVRRVTRGRWEIVTSTPVSPSVQ